jgi:thiol-disulfide isomerase/thioredoxin
MKWLGLAVLSFMNIGLAFGQAGEVKITGQVLHVTSATPKVLGVNFLNPFDNVRKSASLDARSNFSVTGSMRFTQNLTIAYNNTFINLYVSPGDSVHLEIDGALLDQPDFKWLRISGDHAVASTQLNRLHAAVSKLPYQKYNFQLSAPDMLAAVKKDYTRYQDFIDGYIKTQPVGPEVRAFFDRDVKFGISNWIADYVDEGNDQAASRAERIKLFRDPFFGLGNDSNFVTMMYPYHLANYQYWQTKGDSVLAGVKRLAEEPGSLSRDYMIFYLVNGRLKKDPALAKALPDFRPYFTDPTAFTALEYAAQQNQTVNFPPTLFAGVHYLQAGHVKTLPREDLLKLLTKKYPGQVIYLDIYATWCVPCLKEMERAPALHRRFAGKKVAFVNLCLQSTESNWLKLVKQKKLQGENYFLGSDDTKLLMGNFNIGGFPTYLLIDPQGKVVTANAPRPSEFDRLNAAIELLLKKS